MNHSLLTEAKQITGEINVNKMHFRVISKKPQYSAEEALKIRKNISNELYLVFKKYCES